MLLNKRDVHFYATLVIDAFFGVHIRAFCSDKICWLTHELLNYECSFFFFFERGRRTIFFFLFLVRNFCVTLGMYPFMNPKIVLCAVRPMWSVVPRLYILNEMKMCLFFCLFVSYLTLLLHAVQCCQSVRET